jgi:hypothetical protein
MRLLGAVSSVGNRMKLVDFDPAVRPCPPLNQDKVDIIFELQGSTFLVDTDAARFPAGFRLKLQRITCSPMPEFRS